MDPSCPDLGHAAFGNVAAFAKVALGSRLRPMCAADEQQGGGGGHQGVVQKQWERGPPVLPDAVLSPE